MQSPVVAKSEHGHQGSLATEVRDAVSGVSDRRDAFEDDQVQQRSATFEGLVIKKDWLFVQEGTFFGEGRGPVQPRNQRSNEWRFCLPNSQLQHRVPSDFAF